MARLVPINVQKHFLNIMIMLLIILAFCTISLLQVDAQSGRLPLTEPSEVKALGEIATQVGKTWNFDVDPCSGNDTSWVNPISDDMPLYNNTVTCNCSYPDGFCHVTSIVLKGQDLSGELPPSIAKLPYLTRVDFTRNYLRGNIPREWASTKLEYLIVTVNNLSGPIPAYLGSITTLIYVSLQNNLFSGNVPPDIGKLVNLENLILSANNLTGELPVALTNLTKLTELRVSSNNFTGRIPDIFQSWNQLQILEIQGSGFQGPIPSSICVLENLTELKISDLNGGASEFPPLRNMTVMESLMLRSCNLYGPIPDDILLAMKYMSKLDLSFNKLEGSVPNFGDHNNPKMLYLTSNLLTGSIPEWMMTKSRDSTNRYQIDISYNNFSESSEPTTCPENL